MRCVSDEELEWYRLAIRHLHELIAGARALPGERWNEHAAFLDLLIRRYESMLVELEDRAAHHQKETCGEVKTGQVSLRPPEGNAR
jgi:hypothetical protein